jgi:hypothetical protein
MWYDQAQRRQLLRFRQAIANSDDTRVRIDGDWRGIVFVPPRSDTRDSSWSPLATL